MANPYEPSNVTSATVVIQRRAVRRYLFGSAGLLVLGIAVVMPGLRLLNQEFGWISTGSAIFDIEFNGQPVSNATVIRYFLGTGLTLWAVAGVLAVKASMNRRHNRLLENANRDPSS